MNDSEINAELDKKYYDTAKKILEKWDAFQEVLYSYDDAVNNLDEVAESDTDAAELEKKANDINENSTDTEVAEALSEAMSAEAEMVKGSMATEDIIVRSYLEAAKYGDGTMLDFFDREASELEGDEAIRELYPIAEALSGGQLAGLDFLSIKDMILMAITDENGYDISKTESIATASIYQDVNREIYEKGGVALTNDALRAKANAQDQESVSPISTLGIVLWSCTAVTSGAAATSAILMTKAAEAQKNLVKPVMDATLAGKIETVEKNLSRWQDTLSWYTESNMKQDAFNMGRWLHEKKVSTRNVNKLLDELKPLKEAEAAEENAQKQFEEATKSLSTKSTICKYLSIGFSVLAAALAVYSIVTTVMDFIAYYNVDFAPIPKYIVDEVDITATNEKGEKVMIQNQTAYYKAVLCNRTAGSTDVEKKNLEILGDRNDLNGDVGKQWLALYSVKYENGMPILADSFKVRMGNTDLPEGYSTGIHRFGEKSAFNLTSKYYCYNDPNNGTYVFFKNDNATVKALTAAGSLFSGGSIMIGVGIGLVAGSVITVIIMKAVSKKKKEKTK